MFTAPRVSEPQSLYQLGWAYAPEGMFAFDSVTGELIDANPSAEGLSGYSREELLRMHIAMLHPEDERERVKAAFLGAKGQPSRYTGYHIRRNNGRCASVEISSSKSLVLDGRSVSIWVYIDITGQEEKEHRLSTQNWALEAYAIAALALGRAQPSEQLLLQSICEAITHQSVYVLAWIGIAEDGPERPIRVAGAAGNALDYLDGLHLSWSEDDPAGRGPTGICIRTNKLQILEDAETSPIFGLWRKRAKQFGIRSAVSLPLRIDSGRHGALVVFSERPNAFEAAAIKVFEHLVSELVHGLHALEQEKLLQAERLRLTKTQAKLTEALSAMVAPIVLAMEMRDPYTAGHQSRAAEIAVAIGREMGWEEERLQGLRTAAMVHDIGKISIPAEILTKPGQMNAAERAMINEHAEIGYRILKDIPFVWPIAEIVRQHHEKLDGSGYPRGLKGDEILPEAKVLAVADVVEAMASYRPYRPGIKLHIILQQIEKDAGTLLDPEAVKICLSLFREKHFMVPGWARQ